ncbi:MAG: outer membrane beta-barrel protein [Flavobacteriales bacterium]
MNKRFNIYTGMYRFGFLLLICLLSISGISQINVTTFGLQVKPMVPSKFFDTGPTSITSENLTVVFTPKFGLNMGMVIRRGLTKNWSFETGINMVQRNYDLEFQHPFPRTNQHLKFRYIGYEIPLQALIYVRLTDKLWMNASGGVSIDIYPSDVRSNTSLFQDTTAIDYQQLTIKNNWIQLSLLVNYGFEWRTKEDGYFYFGASFHRPFSDIGYTVTSLSINNSQVASLVYALKGSYLTADFRYFFHEKPEKRKKPKK